MAKSFIKSPATPIATPPAGHKGSSGIFDGKHKGPFGAYPRTPSKDGAPEKFYDTNAPFGKFPTDD